MLTLDHIAVSAETLEQGVDFIETALEVPMAGGGRHEILVPTTSYCAWVIHILRLSQLIPWLVICLIPDGSILIDLMGRRGSVIGFAELETLKQPYGLR